MIKPCNARSFNSCLYVCTISNLGLVLLHIKSFEILIHVKYLTCDNIPMDPVHKKTLDPTLSKYSICFKIHHSNIILLP